MVFAYKDFLFKLVGSIYDDRVLLRFQRDLVSYTQNSTNTFLRYLSDIDGLMKRYKLKSDFTSLIPRIRDHLRHDKELSTVLKSYLKNYSKIEEVELYLALTFAHVISHNNARSVKLPLNTVKEVADILNNYLHTKGFKNLRAKQLQKYEPTQLVVRVKNKIF